MKHILIINGPNLNLLGTREPSIYGNTTFDNYLKDLRNEFQEIAIDYMQTNHEGEIIDKLHEVGFTIDGILLNAGAYTHTSIAIADAIKAIQEEYVDYVIINSTSLSASLYKKVVEKVTSFSKFHLWNNSVI